MGTELGEEEHKLDHTKSDSDTVLTTETARTAAAHLVYFHECKAVFTSQHLILEPVRALMSAAIPHRSTVEARILGRT